MSYFGYGNGGMVSPSQMSADPNDMMSMLDSSLFPPFDDNMNMAMNMNIDHNEELAQSFATGGGGAGLQSAISGLAGQQIDQSPFSPDDAASTAGGGGGPGAGGALVPAATPASSSAAAAAAAASAENTLTEFTKRRNWPAKVVEQIQDFLHILDENGRIKHVSPSVERLTGYKPEELQDRFLKDLIHPDDVGVFTSELNEAIAKGSQLRLFYRLRRPDGNKWTIFESVGHAHIASAKFAPTPDNQSPFCQAIFMMSRPYPTKNAAFLDSFLEHKIENERLKRRIAELKREEEDEAAESQRTWRQSQEGRSDVTPSDDAAMRFTNIGTTQYPLPGSDNSMPPPSLPASSLNSALTRENLEGMAGSRPDSIRDKMARYEGTHVDTIERLTGLRYRDGESARAIASGNGSPTLIRGDVGIAISAERDSRSGDKKKKLKVAEEYVCTDCGTLESPEWRKGPNGPKTLCNACGLRWAKKEKKSRANGGGGGDMNDH
ncbi:putative white collar 2 protein [Podospora australis]|uniref:White collar 2 protein n=1 Tax=Podospora australis TaxID=1536484 RepID=A0AAN6X4C8_9PEZI|nr:putative white collar 2 protein [Podospora australis]